MSEGTKKWELLTDVDFIGSEIAGTDLVGFLEFADDVWLVCSHREGSSGSEPSELSSPVSHPSEPPDLDAIPF